MNTAMAADDMIAEQGAETVIHLPNGLLGLEHLKKYVLISNPGEQPFSWMQVLGDSSLAFLVVSPFDVAPDYAPDIPAEDANYLELEDPSDAILFNIVTLRKKGRSTVNLKGPIVVNRYTWTGKQVVLANAGDYSVQHPIPQGD